jgi:hypothetical protein
MKHKEWCDIISGLITDHATDAKYLIIMCYSNWTTQHYLISLWIWNIAMYVSRYGKPLRNQIRSLADVDRLWLNTGMEKQGKYLYRDFPQQNQDPGIRPIHIEMYR